MKKNFLTILSLVIVVGSYGQTLSDNISLSAYSGQTSIQALKSITLQDGFHIPVQSNKSVTISIAGFQNILSTPTAGQNYILTRTFRSPGVTTANLNTQRTIGDENQTVQYFDGLGRAAQTVQLMASPTYKDIVQHIEYDGLGRENTKYLPYAELSGNGSFRSAAKTTQADFYKVGGGWDLTVMKTGNPYAVAVFESSPLNRVQQQGAPGAAWQPAANRNTVPSGANGGRTVVTDYGTNDVNDVRLWTINTSNDGATASYYTAGRLYKTVLKDENWINKNGTELSPSKEGTVEEFKDFEDRVVLKRIWETESKALNTYYVYDDFGDLRYVLPPGFTGTTFSETVNGDFFELIYAYKYDARKRIVKKKIPGKGWEYFVYNNNDQVVFTRDAEQLARSEWSFTKYDAQGRVILTGIEKGHTGDDQSSLQSSLSSFTGPLWEQRGTAIEGYTNNTIPQNTGNITVQAVNYYDNYTSIPGLPFTDHSTYSIRTQSLPVANKVLVLDSSPAKWLWTVNDYDDQGRIVKVSSTNHLGGTDIVTNEYNFSDQLVKITRIHTPATGAAVILTTGNDYDHQGRLVQIRKKVNSQTEVIQSKLSYNEIGQLTTKSLHSENGGSNFMTSIAYAYNERGWQTKASSAQFTSLLNYNVNGTTVLANAQYNGNIAQQLWGYAATTSSTFNYNYDVLNRLKSGVSSGTVMSETLEYDDMGNIRKLIRDNGTAITYGYNNNNKSNRLNTLSGGLTGSFTYDLNGNATKDRTGMLLSYNQLNLPKTVSGGGKTMTYSYDANGTKLSRLSDIGGIKTQRDYIGGLEYSKAGTASSVIERIATEDGFLLNSSGTYSYYYNLTDHLGNVRVVLKKEGTATAPTAAIMQKQDYYPFGKTKSIATNIDNKYLYNGKEMQSDLNGGTHTLGGSYVLEGQLDYGARFYDAETGRWNVVDPLAEKMRMYSPYNYTLNNPVRLIDPDGNAPADGNTLTTLDVVNNVQVVSETNIKTAYSNQKNGIRTSTTTMTTASVDVNSEDSQSGMVIKNGRTVTSTVTQEQKFNTKTKQWENSGNAITSSVTKKGYDAKTFKNVGTAANAVKNYGVNTKGETMYTALQNAKSGTGMGMIAGVGSLPLSMTGVSMTPKLLERLGAGLGLSTVGTIGKHLSSSTVILSVGSYQNKVNSFNAQRPPEVRAIQNAMYKYSLGLIEKLFD